MDMRGYVEAASEAATAPPFSGPGIHVKKSSFIFCQTLLVLVYYRQN